ncbi:unnamed protein product [Musa textilis]
MSSGPSNQLLQCFLNLNSDHSIDPDSQLGSAMSSFMSSQSSSSAAPAKSCGFRELGACLQRIDDSSEEVSPRSQVTDASGNSCPKGDLSKLDNVRRHLPQAMGGLTIAGNLALAHLEQFAACPVFVESAVRLSSLDAQNRCWRSSHLELPGNANLHSSVASNQFPTVRYAELWNSREETSVSDPISVSGEASLRAPRDSNAKKRKAPLKSKEKDTIQPKSVVDPPKVADEEDSDAKRCRSAGNNNEIGNEQNDGARTRRNGEEKQERESNDKPSEPSKDYVHVRARRGQATDSHSLAERVRREKISERMKLLQDLVPGCSKATGKAVMLDEIIDYVQSLQRQVEFLSMKLATESPELDFNNLTNFCANNMIQICRPVPDSVYQVEMSMASSHAKQPQQRTNRLGSTCFMNMLDPTCHLSLVAHQAFLNGLGDASSQLGTFWEDDLQSVASLWNFHGGINSCNENS